MSKRREEAAGTGPAIYSFDWAVDKLITPVLTGLVLTVFGVLAPGWISTHYRTPTCRDPRGLVQVTPSRATGAAKPSDHFTVRGLVTYGAANLVDGNTSTAWVEGRPGLGLDSSVDLRFTHPVDLRMLCVVDGYAQSWDLYKRNSRARLLAVDTSRGHRTAMLADDGTPDRPAVYQQASCPPGSTSDITLTLQSAYAAQQDTSRTSAYTDTSISEIEVWVKP